MSDFFLSQIFEIQNILHLAQEEGSSPEVWQLANLKVLHSPRRPGHSEGDLEGLPLPLPTAPLLVLTFLPET